MLEWTRNPFTSNIKNFVIKKTEESLTGNTANNFYTELYLTFLNILEILLTQINTFLFHFVSKIIFSKRKKSNRGINLTATRWDYHLIELPVEWLIDDAMFVCLLDELILGFSYNELTLETAGFELALTSTFALQANRLTKCAGHPGDSW